MRCGKVNSKTLLPRLEVAVGLRCGKATLKHRDLWRGSIRCSLATVAGALSFFPSRRSRQRLATSSPFSKRPNGKEPSRVGLMLPTTRAPLMKTPIGSAGPALSSRTLTHAHQAASRPVEQVEEPTLRGGPVVTPRPPARSAGRYSRKSTEESFLSSRRSSLEPPAPSGAVRSASCDFSPKSEGDTARETMDSDSHRDPAVSYTHLTLPTKRIV